MQKKGTTGGHVLRKIPGYFKGLADKRWEKERHKKIIALVDAFSRREVIESLFPYYSISYRKNLRKFGIIRLRQILLEKELQRAKFNR